MKYDISKTVGNTPLIPLKTFAKRNNIKANIFAKAEYRNPFGSIKDRAALKIIEEAEKNNLISDNKTIIEATSGNMGIALSAICKSKGYHCRIVMPENMSEKRKELIKNYGAELILTSEKDGMRGSIEKTKELLKNTSDLYYTNQFSNYASVLAHKLSTAPEIYRQLNGKVDILIMGIGTGATLMGIAEYFKHINRQTQIIGMLPKQYPHSIQGIGAGFKPPLLDYSVIDRIIMVNDLEAFSEKDDILKTENLFVGISSGAVLAGLKKLLQDEDCSQKNIVVIFADGGERYI